MDAKLCPVCHTRVWPEGCQCKPIPCPSCATKQTRIEELEQIIRESSDAELRETLDKLKEACKVDPKLLDEPADI